MNFANNLGWVLDSRILDLSQNFHLSDFKDKAHQKQVRVKKGQRQADL